jgi:hypothetical protein
MMESKHMASSAPMNEQSLVAIAIYRPVTDLNRTLAVLDS